MKVLLSLILVFSTVSVFGDWPTYLDDYPNVRPSWSGAWFNPDQSGHGINIEILDEERTVIYWYTYDLDGNPIWLIAEGVNSQVWSDELWLSGGIRVEATAYYHEGMMFGEFDPATNQRQEWGKIVLHFTHDFCDFAGMEWYPVMEGFSQGFTLLQRLTTLYDLDCAYQLGNTAGHWEVQFGFDAEHKYQVELVSTRDPENPPEYPDFSPRTFEFYDETGCLWSGGINYSLFGLHANWGNECGATAVEQWAYGHNVFEYRLCNSENECVRKDQIMIFQDDGEHLIFSR